MTGIDVAEPTVPELKPGTAFSDACKITEFVPLNDIFDAEISPPEIPKFCE